ncbi:MAG: hypothetical protein ACJASK_000802, partial [Ilumatobacter sp.]
FFSLRSLGSSMTLILIGAASLARRKPDHRSV